MERLPEDGYIDAIHLAGEWGNRIDELAWLAAGIAFLGVFADENDIPDLGNDSVAATRTVYAMADFAGVDPDTFAAIVNNQWDMISARAIKPLSEG